MMNLGVITCGGDCPGLNSVLYGLGKSSKNHNVKLIGIYQSGVNSSKACYKAIEFNPNASLLQTGGTILGTIVDADLRKHGFSSTEQGKALKALLKTLDLEALVVIGGDGGIKIMHNLCEKISLPMIAVPKTIDNDVKNTTYSIGYQSCIETVVEAIDKIRTTAESHRRVMIVEVMGRHAGYIALMSGIASGVDVILIPEIDYSIDQLKEFIKARYVEEDRGLMIVVAEGIKSPEGNYVYLTENAYGGISQVLAKKIETDLNIPARAIRLGHLQRGGKPSAYDRYMGVLMGNKALALVLEKKYNHMVVWKDHEVGAVPLEHELQQKISEIEVWWHRARDLGVFIGG